VLRAHQLVDTTIRNLDEQAHEALRARAVLEGRTVGEVMHEAIRRYLARCTPEKRSFEKRGPSMFLPGTKT
jgi:plasmid stability protein